MSAALSSLRVLDLGTIITAPLAGRMLSEFGAEVIKVEHPNGDPFRAFRAGESPAFAAYNKGKQSVTLDLTTERGKQLLHALLAESDVLLENFRPGVLARLGFEPKALAARNPRLIHCSISGFGADGPYSARPAYDAVAQAVSGLSSLWVDPQNPRLSGPVIADSVTGMYAAMAILAALEQRHTTGRGCRIEVNMLESCMAFICGDFAMAASTGENPGMYTRVAGSQSFAFRCADGKLVAIHMSSQEKFWLGLLRAIGRTDLASDPRFATRENRVSNYEVMHGVLALEFGRRNRAEMCAALEKEDVPFGALNTFEEVYEDPQVKHLGTFERDLRTGRPVVTVRRPVLIDGQRDEVSSPAPALGADNGILARFGDRNPAG